jgi:hypothetical protein
VAAQSKAWFCGRLSAEIGGLNLAGGMNSCLLWVLCVFSADHSSRGVLPTVVCHCLWSINLMNEKAIARAGARRHKKEKMIQCKFSSPHVGFASHNAVFIETATSQTGELTNKTTFTTYFQTLVVYLNPRNTLKSSWKAMAIKCFPVWNHTSLEHVRQMFAYTHSAIGFIKTHFY